MKKLAVVVLCLGILGLALYPFVGSGTPAPRTVSFPAYPWANKLSLSQAPHSAYSEQIFADPVERAVHRLEWGKTDLIRWTQNHLPGPTDRLVRRLCERAQDVAAGAPLGARRLLETLGILGRGEAVPTLLLFAQQDPDYLQLAAIEALTHCPLTEEVSEVLARLSGSSNPQVSSAATRAVLNRSEDWDHERILAFLEGRNNEQVNLLLSEVGKRRLSFAADAVARHLESDQLRTRQLAVGALLALRDPRSIEAGKEELRHSDARRLGQGLVLYRDANLLPPLDIAQELADHPDTSLQLVLAQVLGPTPDEAESANDLCVRILEQLVDSADESTRRVAIHSLYQRGHQLHLQAYRQDLERAYGAALKDAVKFLCEQVRDPVSAEVVRRRLAGVLDPLDRVNLLFGLRFVGDVGDADMFLSWMVIGGTEEDRVASEQTYVSEFAALYLQDLGAGVSERLLERFPEASTTWAKLCLLDTLRGVATGSTSELQLVRDLIQDPTMPIEVQIGAADTLPYLWNQDLGDEILALAADASSQELGRHLQQLFACYF